MLTGACAATCESAGPVPASWSVLTALKYMRLSHDVVHGEFPVQFSQLTGLTELQLDSTKILFNLSPTFSTLREMAFM